MTFLFANEGKWFMATKKKTDQDLQLDKDQLKASIVRHLRSTLVQANRKPLRSAWWKATAAAVNEQVYERSDPHSADSLQERYSCDSLSLC